MRKRIGKVEVSDMYCTLCGKKGITVPRMNGGFRAAGHLKKLYCLYCGKETNHCEVRPFGTYTYETFKFEFDNHNFDENGNRILTLGELKNKVYSKEN